ncbi:hypothetical protein DESC_780459 [Desulfosarcina cetonica]|nr:hypothetical protein DESC_780459 [Desulfosarcina cetonica]
MKYTFNSSRCIPTDHTKLLLYFLDVNIKKAPGISFAKVVVQSLRFLRKLPFLVIKNTVMEDIQ